MLLKFIWIQPFLCRFVFQKCTSEYIPVCNTSDVYYAYVVLTKAPTDKYVHIIFYDENKQYANRILVRTTTNVNTIYNIRSIISVLSTKLQELLLQVTTALMQKHLMPRWHRYHPEYRWSSLQWPGLPPIPERELPWAVFLTRDFL